MWNFFIVHIKLSVIRIYLSSDSLDYPQINGKWGNRSKVEKLRYNLRVNAALNDIQHVVFKAECIEGVREVRQWIYDRGVIALEIRPAYCSWQCIQPVQIASYTHTHKWTSEQVSEIELDENTGNTWLSGITGLIISLVTSDRWPHTHHHHHC